MPKQIISLPPTVPQSTSYSSNNSKLLSTKKIISVVTTDGIATFSGGTVTNLVFPIDPQDAISKEFVDNLSVAKPLNSVQFNYNNSFSGTENFTFDSDTNILNVNGPINSWSTLNSFVINITDGFITGIQDNLIYIPDSIVNKKYIDITTPSNTIIEKKSNNGVIYNATDMINTVIIRYCDPHESFPEIVPDLTATANSIITELGLTAFVGFTAKFKIINFDPNFAPLNTDKITIQLYPNNGVTFYPNVEYYTIEIGYCLDITIVVTSISPRRVTMVINNCKPSKFYESFAPRPSNTSMFSNAADFLNTNYTLADNLLWNTIPGTIYLVDYNYSTIDIKNQLIVRNPLANSTDIFGYNLDPKYLNQIIYIKNISSNSITITGQTNIWQISSFITNGLGPNEQFTIAIRPLDISIPSGGSGYNIGIYNTINLTNPEYGIGLRVNVTSIGTTATITNAGTGYTNDSYTTTNLSNPSATGLKINCTATAGLITSFQDIIGYLTGYKDGDVLKLNGGNNNAQITLNLVNTIKKCVINTLGNGVYATGDVLEISGPGTGRGSGANIVLSELFSLRLLGKN